MHTCSHRIDNHQYTWKVETLWDLVSDIDPVAMPLDRFDHLLDYTVWGEDPMTPRVLIEHYSRALESDLHYPIIISLDHRGVVDHLFDGFHRLVKAHYLQAEKILVRVVEKEILCQSYASRKELFCDCCGCNPCDCNWGYHFT